MSIFKKAWKSVKGAFKSIAKGIKSAAKSVGKFMDKIGVVGQIGLMFILPGVGNFLAKGLGTMTNALAASSNSLLAGAGKVLQTVGKFANTAGNAFKTVTDGVRGFVSNVGKGMVNQVGSLLGKTTPVIQGAPSTIGEGFKTWMTGVADDVANITSPFRAPAVAIETSIDKGFNTAFDPPDFDTFDPTQTFGPKNEDWRFYDVPRDSYMNVVEQERGAFRRLAGQTVKYAADTLKALPERTIDAVADTTVRGLGDRTLQAMGVQTQPTYNVQNISNVVPQFRSTPIQSAYESVGVNYGATPNSRLEYFASSYPVGDFGRSAFEAYTGFRG